MLHFGASVNKMQNAVSPEPLAFRGFLSEGLALSQLSEHSHLYIPSTPPLHPPPHLLYPPASSFHSSSLLAAALDSSTLPLRLIGGLGLSGA